MLLALLYLVLLALFVLVLLALVRCCNTDYQRQDLHQPPGSQLLTADTNLDSHA